MCLPAINFERKTMNAAGRVYVCNLIFPLDSDRYRIMLATWSLCTIYKIISSDARFRGEYFQMCRKRIVNSD